MKNRLTRENVIIIISLFTMLLIFVGITYAFFTANNPEGSTAQIISDTGRMLITYDDGTESIVPVTDIQPSNKILVNKTFTLTGLNTAVGLNSDDGLAMPYRVGVKYKSTFSDGMIHYYIKEVESDSDADVTANFVVTPEEGKTDADYINQTVPGNDTYTGYVHGTLLSGGKYFEMVSGEFPAKLENQKITFNLIIQFPDNNENQDSEKGKTFNGKVVVNHEPSFKDDSWEEIADNIKTENSEVYKVGDEKEVEIDGVNYTVRVANNSTPAECLTDGFSQTACGFVVEFVDIVENKTNIFPSIDESNWKSGEMRTYLNNDFLNKLPEDLRNNIIDTLVITGHGSNDDADFETTDKIYLLSAKEVWNGSGTTAKDKQRQLDYYASKKVLNNQNASYAIKKYNGSDAAWYLRTKYSGYTWYMIYVKADGTSTYGGGGNRGVAPAFRIG